MTRTENYDVVIKNPCINQSLVTIGSTTRSAESYLVGTGPYEWNSGSAYTIDTLPITHSLCGPLLYTASYDSTNIDSLTGTVSMSRSDQDFTIETADDTLINQSKPYTLAAQFVDYPLDSFTSVSIAT